MGIRENLARALKYEEELRREYRWYAHYASRDPEVRQMFEEFAQDQDEHIQALKEKLREYPVKR
ncbi:hypothetical protein SY88_04375 [Clostridiales bacterium PH28_bin88]|nr:hypothetical protein SY88_04375 [Clostridiales bacterium PH28_bin88]